MTVSLVSYAYVEPGGSAPPMIERTTSTEVRSYLEAHVAALHESTERGQISPAVFRSVDARTRFSQLANGTKAEFLASSQQLVERLQRGMDQRTKRGFFVTLRRDTTPPQAAALKLDVHDAAAAALALDDTGQPTLEAVKDLLDIPGELQKGAVIPDTRPHSELIVGDKLTFTSLYFLEALDAEQHAAPGPATIDLIRVVQDVAPDKAVAAAGALEAEPRTSVAGFFEQHPELLNADEQAAVLDRARTRKRPIDEVDPSSSVIRETLEADGIVIRGRASTISQKLRVLPRPGGYRIQIDVDEEPRRRFT